MTSSTEIFLLGATCSKIGSGSTPRGGKNTYLDFGPVSLIRSQNILNSGFSNTGLAFISNEQAKALDGVAIEEGDVLLNITGDSVARVCQAPRHVLPARVNQHVAIIRPKPDLLDSAFLRYFLVSPEQQLLLLTLASSGATRNALTKRMIERLEVPALPMDEQRDIARVLASLDDRIDHNRALAANLEAIARRLFKSWFVDFDPVRSKAAGEKPPGLADDIAALFPDRFVESKIGEVPEGWVYQPITSIASVFSGGTPKRSVTEYWEGDIPWYSVVDAPKGSDTFVVQTSEYITQLGLAKSAAKLLPAGVTIMSARGTVGKLALTCGPMTINQSCYAMKGGLGDYLTYFTIAQSVEWLKQNVHGAVFDTITKATLDGMMVVIPPGKVARAFEVVVKPLMVRIETSVRERHTLLGIRDLLLPRLISGKLRVNDAAAIIKEAVA